VSFGVGHARGVGLWKLAAILPYLVELQLNGVIKPSEIRTVLREVCKLPLEEIERPAV